jgi:hypothetical protein
MASVTLIRYLRRCTSQPAQEIIYSGTNKAPELKDESFPACSEGDIPRLGGT